MKIKAKRQGYYNDNLVRVGQVIEFEGEKIPSWATLVNGKEASKTDESTNAQLELKLTQELDALITEATGMSVWVNGTGKSLEEQIAEYKDAIAAKKVELAATGEQTTDMDIEGSTVTANANTTGTAVEGDTSTLDALTDEQLNEKLDALITEAIDNNVLLEGAENLTVKEQIIKLQEAIAAEKTNG